MKRKHLFGFKEVTEEEKTERVTHVFNQVAPHYDLMNDLMSFGLHRFWKRMAVGVVSLSDQSRVLDVACGSGDLALLWWKKKVSVVATDVNASMLSLAHKKAIDQGALIPFIQCDGENLPFPNGSFDIVSCSFGLRNMTNKEKFLQEAYRVLTRGGQLIILEFSHPTPFVKKLYDCYSFRFIPWLGKKVTNNKNSYQYLVESIRVHPDQERLSTMIRDAGFHAVNSYPFLCQVVALQIAIK